jgi:hypothetical protein
LKNWCAKVSNIEHNLNSCMYYLNKVINLDQVCDNWANGKWPIFIIWLKLSNRCTDNSPSFSHNVLEHHQNIIFPEFMTKRTISIYILYFSSFNSTSHSLVAKIAKGNEWNKTFLLSWIIEGATEEIYKFQNCFHNIKWGKHL